ncbi:unnamed protein product [Microthlaspi erraticum]|uniref:Uncharacterized protein n=1 Tax=Microthlaspi erraticum TaxID=1685480 RepID=A0A6D2HWC1_9BRAS|nr:unnamed protein product [Microthlaspi erraticum]
MWPICTDKTNLPGSLLFLITSTALHSSDTSMTFSSSATFPDISSFMYFFKQESSEQHQTEAASQSSPSTSPYTLHPPSLFWTSSVEQGKEASSSARSTPLEAARSTSAHMFRILVGFLLACPFRRNRSR